jgi:integrase
VPIPPELVALLREHIAQSCTGTCGRLFRSQNGNPIQPSTWWHVWQKARAIALTPVQAATPPLRRPYDYADVRVMPTSAGTSCSSGVKARKLSA